MVASEILNPPVTDPAGCRGSGGPAMLSGMTLMNFIDGQYVAGALWPALFQFGIDTIGWRHTMLAYGVLIGTVQPVDWPAAELAARRAATMRT